VSNEPTQRVLEPCQFLAAALGAQMPATGAAFEVNAMQSEQGKEQDISAVILQMGKQASLRQEK
jgi:hypothetical protein